MEPEKKEKIVSKKNQPIDWFDLGTKILLGLGSAFIGGMAAEAGASTFRKMSTTQNKDNLHLLKTGT